MNPTTQQPSHVASGSTAGGEHETSEDTVMTGQRPSRSRNRGRNNRNSTFRGDCPDLDGVVYDLGLPHSHQDLFTMVTQQIAEYVARKFEHASEFWRGMTELSLATLTPPTAPASDSGLGAVKEYKIHLKEYRTALKHRKENQERIFSLLLGQCSRTIRNRLEAHSTWGTIDAASDVIRLLELIRQSLFTQATTRHATHTYIEAEAALARFRQGERMSNSDYLEKLKGLIHVFEHLGGEPGVTEDRVRSIIEAKNKATKTGKDSKVSEDDRAQARAQAREEYIAVLLIVKSDPKRYGQLIRDIENKHTRGINGYPTTLSEAYNILVNYRSRDTGRQSNHESVISFAVTEGDDDSRHGSGGRRG